MKAWTELQRGLYAVMVTLSFVTARAFGFKYLTNFLAMNLEIMRMASQIEAGRDIDFDFDEFVIKRIVEVV
jgi:hypothetical protein